MKYFDHTEVIDFSNYNEIIFNPKSSSFALLVVDDENYQTESLKNFCQRLLESGLSWFGAAGKTARSLDNSMDLAIADPKNGSKFAEVETSSFESDSIENSVWSALNRIGIAEKYFDSCKTLFIVVRNNNNLSEKVREWILRLQAS